MYWVEMSHDWPARISTGISFSVRKRQERNQICIEAYYYLVIYSQAWPRIGGTNNDVRNYRQPATGVFDNSRIPALFRLANLPTANCLAILWHYQLYYYQAWRQLCDMDNLSARLMPMFCIFPS